LSFSSLIGEIPSEIGLCTALTALRLEKNLLSGSVPNALQKLVKLKTVLLNDNFKLMGNFSDDIAVLSNLEYLNIYSTAISIEYSTLCNATKSGKRITSSLPTCNTT
jgi:hypothetical protein